MSINLNNPQEHCFSNSSALLSIKSTPSASDTYLTTEELSERIKYDARTIRSCLKDSVLLEGIHYFRPFGGRKILYIWAQIEKDMMLSASVDSLMIGIK